MSEITYNLEVADLMAFYRHHRRTSATHRRLRVLLSLIIVGAALAVTSHAESGSAAFRVLYFLAMIGLYTLVTIVVSFVVRRISYYQAHQGAERHGILGKHTIQLTPNELCERTPVNETKTAWRSIFRMDDSPQHIFIFTQPNAAHVIPRRAFSSPEAFDEFLATARAYYQAALQRDQPNATVAPMKKSPTGADD